MIELMVESIIIILMLLGSALMVVAGIGLLRMPDLYTRMSASTKASTLGMAALLAAAGFFFSEGTAVAQIFATIAFVLLTAPIGAHVIARAAYRRGKAPLFERTTVDELGVYYKQHNDTYHTGDKPHGDHGARHSHAQSAE